MTASGLWQDIGAGENLLTRLLRLLFLLAATVVFCFLAVLPLTWPQQAVLGLLSLLMALAMARSSDSYLVTLALMMMSMFCTFRYGYWRILQVVRFFGERWTPSSSVASSWPKHMHSSSFFWATFKPSGLCGAHPFHYPTTQKTGHMSMS